MQPKFCEYDFKLNPDPHVILSVNQNSIIVDSLAI